MSQRWEPTPGRAIRASPLRPFTGEIVSLSRDDEIYFLTQFQIRPEIAYINIMVAPETQRYVLPIRGPNDVGRGYVLRKPWNGAPRIAACVGCPKADTYVSKLEPVQSFYRGRQRAASKPLVAVEDQLSAIKLMNADYDSVALLGVPWSKDFSGYQGADRVAEIAQVAGDRGLIVALDADATESAFEFVRKWRYAFSSIRVAILEKDIKDTKLADIGRVLGV